MCDLVMCCHGFERMWCGSNAPSAHRWLRMKFEFRIDCILMLLLAFFVCSQRVDDSSNPSSRIKWKELGTGTEVKLEHDRNEWEIIAIEPHLASVLFCLVGRSIDRSMLDRFPICRITIELWCHSSAVLLLLLLYLFVSLPWCRCR